MSVFTIYILSRIISQEEIMEPVRVWIARKNNFLGHGIQCFFCVSCWVSIALCWGNSLEWLCVHISLANVIHVLMEKLK